MDHTLFLSVYPIGYIIYNDHIYKSGGAYVDLKYDDLMFVDKIIKNK